MPSNMSRLHEWQNRRWFFSCVLHHVAARVVEFFILIILGVEGVDHVDAGQVLARNAVDLIGQLLHPAEARQAD